MINVQEKLLQPEEIFVFDFVGFSIDFGCIFNF